MEQGGVEHEIGVATGNNMVTTKDIVSCSTLLN